MKKTFFIFLSAVIIISCFALNICAVKNAFSEIWVTPDCPIIIDNASTAKAASYVEGFGIGNTSEGDYVQFDEVDFGSSGAKNAILGFAYGQDSEVTIELYIDSVESNPVAIFQITGTGGWDQAHIKEFIQPVNIQAGKHSVFVKWVNGTGSLHYIEFESETPANQSEDDNSKEGNSDNSSDSAVVDNSTGAQLKPGAETEAPQTSDSGIAVSLVTAILSGAALIAIKKKK